MHWIFLFTAIIFEVTATSFLKFSHGWTKLIPSIMAIIFFPISTMIYSLALKRIDISIAYALWSGIGTTLMAVVGWWVFKENLSLQKMGFMSLIIIGIVGLRFSN